MRRAVPRTTGGLVALTGMVALLLVAAVQLSDPHSYLSEAVPRVGEAGSGPSATLTDLSSIDQLKGSFNNEAGHPRLILLLSPT